jgi:hypothetical protein
VVRVTRCHLPVRVRDVQFWGLRFKGNDTGLESVKLFDWNVATSQVKPHHIRQAHIVSPTPLFDMHGHLMMPHAANILSIVAAMFVWLTLTAELIFVRLIAACGPDYNALLS